MKPVHFGVVSLMIASTLAAGWKSGSVRQPAAGAQRCRARRAGLHADRERAGSFLDQP